MIETDSPDHPVWKLELTADLVAKAEIRPAHPDQKTFRYNGKPSRWIWQVTVRRPADGRRTVLSTVTVAEPLEAKFIGPIREVTSPGAVVEVSREIEVGLPETREFGRRNSAMKIRLDDGSTMEALLSWFVEDPIHITPAGLVLIKGDGAMKKVFTLETSGDPFRVIDVTSDLLARAASIPSQSSSIHRIEMELDLSQIADGSTARVVIKVEDPIPREIVVSALIIERRSGGSR